MRVLAVHIVKLQGRVGTAGCGTATWASPKPGLRPPAAAAARPTVRPRARRAVVRVEVGSSRRRLPLMLGPLHSISLLKSPLLLRVSLPLLLHFSLHLLLLLVRLLLVVVLLPCKLVLHLLLLILQHRLVGLLLEQGPLFVGSLLQAHHLVVGLLVDAHLLRPELLLHLHLELMPLLLGGLPQGLLLDLVLVLQHPLALVELSVQAPRISLLLLVDAPRVRDALRQPLGRHWPVRRPHRPHRLHRPHRHGAWHHGRCSRPCRIVIHRSGRGRRWVCGRSHSDGLSSVAYRRRSVGWRHCPMLRRCSRRVHHRGRRCSDRSSGGGPNVRHPGSRRRGRHDAWCGRRHRRSVHRGSGRGGDGVGRHRGRLHRLSRQGLNELRPGDDPIVVPIQHVKYGSTTVD
mmetsp:Transcript_106112/g.342577  ORF Transcript_106112/g.342577 Transcript_106112/m.342577 type:complete len:401 (+) Transcript_106112:163-1365(+)